MAPTTKDQRALCPTLQSYGHLVILSTGKGGDQDASIMGRDESPTAPDTQSVICYPGLTALLFWMLCGVLVCCD